MKPELTRLQNVIDQLLSNRNGLKILEAGCGSATEIHLPGDSILVGIDISEKQLERNIFVQEKILGDVQSYPLPADEFDAIICFYLLEHVDHPELALNNFMRAIKPDGLIVMAFPNVLSLWGMVTKLTPLWFHIFVYRYIFGEKRAGKDDFGPFPTFSRYSIAPKAIEQFARNNGLSVEYLDLYENFRQTGIRERLGVGWQLVRGIIKVLTLGNIATDSTDCIVVLKKPKITVATVT